MNILARNPSCGTLPLFPSLSGADRLAIAAILALYLVAAHLDYADDRLAQAAPVAHAATVVGV